jgi:ribosomal protein L11 methyltransferase
VRNENKNSAKKTSAMTNLHAEATVVARLTTDQTTARRMQDLLAEHFGESVAIAIAQESEDAPDGRWSLALHFRHRPDEGALRALIAALAQQIAGELRARALAQQLTFQTLAPTDWVRKSLEGLTPVNAGRFVVHGTHDRGRFPANRLAIEINAGLAFGTGHHGSTRGCLLALDRIVKLRRAGWAKARVPRSTRVGKTARTPSPPVTSAAGGFAHPTTQSKHAVVLDLGTGTGVLAIAAAKVLHSPVLATDLDARAVSIARENARSDGVALRIEVVHAAGIGNDRLRRRAPFNLVLANILLEPLTRFATPLARLVAPHGHVVLSGLLNAQARPALASYRTRGFVFAQRIVLGGWTTLVVKRPGRV